jgi:predicted nucleic acid-binding Zn ribbon protein
MKLKLCPVCKRPFLAKDEICSRCPRLQYQESWMSLGCLLMMTIVPVAVMLIFWFFFFLGFFLR